MKWVGTARCGVLAAALAAAACAPARPLPAARSGESPRRGDAFAPQTASAKAAAEASGDEVLRQAPLVDRVDGAVLSIPLVRGSVRGIATWILVDTGASSHVVATWLARRAKLTTRDSGQEGADHAGRPVVTRLADAPRLAIDGIGVVEDRAVLTADVPELLERLGIGAFVSPQLLGQSGEHVVLDLDGATLRVLRGPPSQGARAGFRSLSPAIARGRTCAERASTPPSLAFVLEGTVGGHRAALLLDTGSARTDLLSRSRAARALASRQRPSTGARYAASGRVQSKSVAHTEIALGQVTHVADIDVVQGESDAWCPRDGVVGMDVLERCVLVFSGGEARGMCRPHAR